MDGHVNVNISGTSQSSLSSGEPQGEKRKVLNRLPMYVALDSDHFERSNADEATITTFSHGKKVHSFDPDTIRRAAVGSGTDEKSATEPDTFKKSAIDMLKKSFFYTLGIRYPFDAPKLTEEQKTEIKASIQPGDIILTMYPGYPGWQVLEEVTARSHFTHAALYEGDGKVLETLSNSGVTRTELDDTLNDTALLEIIRPPYQTKEDRDSVIAYSQSKLGNSYDYAFNTDNDNELYCSEMLYWALKSMPHPMEVKGNNFMGRYIVGPQALESIPDSKVVFSTGASFMKGLSFYYPVYAGTMAGAAAGATILGPAGFAAGAALGWASSILVGNRIQTGNWGLEL